MVFGEPIFTPIPKLRFFHSLLEPGFNPLVVHSLRYWLMEMLLLGEIPPLVAIVVMFKYSYSRSNRFIPHTMHLQLFSLIGVW